VGVKPQAFPFPDISHDIVNTDSVDVIAFGNLVSVAMSPPDGPIERRLGLNKLSALEPAEPIRRYERDHPGAKPTVMSGNSSTNIKGSDAADISS
jgi:hypothetical protein